MWPFNKVESLKDSGMFEGYTDWHSHILPGVDDGVKDMQTSLEILRRYEELGVAKVWLTPHIMEDCPNGTEELRNRFEELRSAWTGKVEIALAAENMLDSLFEERLERNDLLPIGDAGRHLLVETSYFTPPMELNRIFDDIMKAGYFPVLAHPERYRYMENRDYTNLKKLGVLMQANFVSMVGGYGETARRKAEWLLEENMYDLMGSDLHRLAFIEQSIGQSPRKKRHINRLVELSRKTLE